MPSPESASKSFWLSETKLRESTSVRMEHENSNGTITKFIKSNSTSKSTSSVKNSSKLKVKKVIVIKNNAFFKLK